MPVRPRVPAMGDARPPVPIIVGCGRSGTTLLRSMLDSHPALAIPGEDDFLLAELEEGTPFARGLPVPALWVEERLAEHPAVAAALGDPSATGGEVTFAEWFRGAYGRYAASFGKERFGDKTPGLVAHVTTVAELLPEAVFLHVVRDGRDVALAFLDQPWGPSTVSAAARTWQRLVGAGRRAGGALGPDRYVEVRYEALVDEPEPILRRCCDLLGLDFDAAMLDYRDSATRAADASRYPDSHRRLQQPPTAGLRDWRRDLGAIDRARFESIAGGALRDAGYPLSVPSGARVAVRAARTARVRLRRLTTRTGT